MRVRRGNCPFLTGQERDFETGLDYFGARYFSSLSGQFASPDDFTNATHPTDPQTWNLYAYARNNPLRFIDPDGRIKKDANGKIIFEKESDTTFKFLEDQRVVGANGEVLKDRNGRPLKATVSWKAEKGRVFADDGTAIAAFRATGEIEVTVTDGRQGRR